jgi:hypothetical protein
MRLLSCWWAACSLALGARIEVHVDQAVFTPNTKGRVILYISRHNDTAPLTQSGTARTRARFSVSTHLTLR